MKILKFGGTSVGSPERIKKMVELIHNEDKKIVVLSAMSGTTNKLVEIATALYAKEHEKAGELINKLQEDYLKVIDDLYQSPESIVKGREMINAHFGFIRSFTLDLFTIFEERAILAQGELISTALLQFYLEELHIDSVLLSALNFMRIDVNEEPDFQFIEENLKKELSQFSEKKLFITQGYICRNTFGEVDNLKRGGSDYTASLIGAALTAEEIQIWTDIDGMHNNDPRFVENTYPIAELSFDEAAELAYFGAKILHPSSVMPAKLRNVPVRLLNTMNPQAKGTLISSVSSGENIKAVAAKDDIIAIKIKSGRMLLAYGFMRSVFEVFERFKTPIDMITTSEVAVSITIDNNKFLTEIIEELQTFGTVEVDDGHTIICIVGDFLAEKTGYGIKIFEALKSIPIRMISYGGSKNNISLLVSTSQKKEVLNALNKGIFN
ncbi:MAG: aspartate kinase [Bacteroidetes bacterium]|nr:aspartate kinase [Bacteroidota bacterium]HET6243043.1 aspartate kinase [Bacteroidia bacterium]